MIYVASPYSHPDAAVRQSRYEAACDATAALLCSGKLAYSPICHSHPLAERGLPGDWTFWARHSEAMLETCTELLILPLPGWRTSEGIRAEVAIASKLGVPVRIDATSPTAHQQGPS